MRTAPRVAAALAALFIAGCGEILNDRLRLGLSVCTHSSQCAEGLICDPETSECVGALPACSLCASQSQCGEGKCEPFASDPQVCLYSCDSSSCPQPGFICDSGSCVPDPSVYVGCHAVRQIGMSCSSDQVCIDQGLVNGACADNRCTIRCTSPATCPTGHSCTNVDGRQVCVEP